MLQNERIATFARRLPEELDGALITSEENRQYLTGVHSSDGTLLITREKAYFIIDSRYFEMAKRVARGCEVILTGRLHSQLSELCKTNGIERLGIENAKMTVADFLLCREQLHGCEISMLDGVSRMLSELRMCKLPQEIAYIKAAQKITDDAFTHICDYIRPGLTERQVAGELLDFCYRNGSERPAFDYIVVSGANSSMPHGVPTDKQIAPGDFVTMDFGCVVGGYCSDMTRTIGIGQVSGEQREIYETVGQAQRAAIAAIAPGVACAAVDAAAREIIEAAGYGKCFGHGTGHSVGLEIHELPSFSVRSTAICEAGMVITVEPGIYLPGRFGVRTEDMLLVTEDGSCDLTTSKTELLLL